MEGIGRDRGREKLIPSTLSNALPSVRPDAEFGAFPVEPAEFPWGWGEVGQSEVPDSILVLVNHKFLGTGEAKQVQTSVSLSVKWGQPPWSPGKQPGSYPICLRITSAQHSVRRARGVQWWLEDGRIAWTL